MTNHPQRLFFNGKNWSLFTILIFILLAACAPGGSPVSTTGGRRAEQVNSSPMTSSPNGPKTDRALLFNNRAGADTFRIAVVDLNSGEPAAGAEPVEIGSQINFAFSPDGTMLALASVSVDCQGACLSIFRLADFEQIAKIELPARNIDNDWVHQLAFDPQKERIAMAYSARGEGQIAVVDVSTGAFSQIQVAGLPAFARLMAFSGDGKQIMLVGQVLPESGTTSHDMNPRLEALLLDAQLLELKWRQGLEDVRDGFFGPGDYSKPEESFYYHAGMASDPSARRVYIAHADADRLTTIDFEEHDVRTVDIREKQTPIERLIESLLTLGVQPAQAKAANSFLRNAVLSPDGRTLYVVGERTNIVTAEGNPWEMISTPYGMEAWDIEKGTRLLGVETEATEVRRAPGGKILLNGYTRDTTASLPFTEVFDSSSGRITARLDDAYVYPTLRLNGQPALVSVHTNDLGHTILSVLDDERSLIKDVTWTQESGYFFWPEYR